MKITVGIPAFNCHNTIKDTIISIMNQSFSKKNIKIVIADDASDKGYDEIIKQYEEEINISIVSLKKNMGPGFARQSIIDICDTELITFIDSDDVFFDYFFLEDGVKFFTKNPNLILYRSEFLQELQDKTFNIANSRENWMFGKIYRVSNLRNKNIRFALSRSHEDIEFNKKVELTKKNNETIDYDSKVTYLWKFNKDSITRKNNYEYTLNDGIVGSIKAGISAIKFSLSLNKEINDIMLFEIYDHFFWEYHCYQILFIKNKNKIPMIIDDLKYYYNNFIKDRWEKLPEEEQTNYYYTFLYNSPQKYIPFITVDQFIKMLEK